jgi:hypothetical protein
MHTDSCNAPDRGLCIPYRGYRKMREMQASLPAVRRPSRDLIEGPRRSKLRFAALEEHSGAIDPNHLRRVREPVSRSKSGVQGKVADVAGGRSRHAEPQNELKAFQVLIATARSDAWQEQPFSLEYHLDGTKHRYTPRRIGCLGRSSGGSRIDWWEPHGLACPVRSESFSPRHVGNK